MKCILLRRCVSLNDFFDKWKWNKRKWVKPMSSNRQKFIYKTDNSAFLYSVSLVSLVLKLRNKYEC